MTGWGQPATKGDSLPATGLPLSAVDFSRSISSRKIKLLLSAHTGNFALSPHP